MTAPSVQWLSSIINIQEVPGTISGHTLEIFMIVQSMEWSTLSFVRIIEQLLFMRSSEIWLRKLTLRLWDNALLTTRPPVLPSSSNRFSQSWFFGAVAPQIYFIFIMLQLKPQKITTFSFLECICQLFGILCKC